MSEERMVILKMLEEGKIASEEAERLLRALGGQERDEEEKEREKEGKGEDIFDALGEGMDRAFKAVQNMDFGLIPLWGG